MTASPRDSRPRPSLSLALGLVAMLGAGASMAAAEVTAVRFGQLIPSLPLPSTTSTSAGTRASRGSSTSTPT